MVSRLDHYQEFRHFLVKSLADPRFCEFDEANVELEARNLGVLPEILVAAKKRYHERYLALERVWCAVTIPKELWVLVEEHARALGLPKRDYLRCVLLSSVTNLDYEPRIHEPELSRDKTQFYTFKMDFSAKALIYARARALGVTISRYLRVALHDAWSARLIVKVFSSSWQAPAHQLAEIHAKYGQDLRMMRNTIIRPTYKKKRKKKESTT